ncbi:MAG: hypothetical protein ABEH83_04505 [Halobacterium sp.]
MARRLLALALAALLLTAGCQAPTSPDASAVATDASAATTADSTDATDENESQGYVTTSAAFEVDVERIYVRVGRLLDAPRDLWPRVTIERAEPPEGGGPVTSESTGFTELMGIVASSDSGGEGEGDDGVQTGAVARGTTVTVYNHEELGPRGTENLLAHEYVHVFQTLHDVQTPLVELGRGRNLRLLYGVVVEGAAEWIQEEYAIEYQDVTVDQTTFSDRWRNASAYVRWTLAPYEYGSRYYELRVDDPAAVSDVYDRPPRSTEQVIHGYAPSEEPVADLRVGVRDDDSFELVERSTKGELFARIALSTELGFERAAAAADGWGADRLLRFTDGSASGYAWVLRWDDASEATEFQDAFADYTANRSVPFDTAHVSDETVVVFAGADAFVENASATGTDGDVTVRA